MSLERTEVHYSPAYFEGSALCGVKAQTFTNALDLVTCPACLEAERAGRPPSPTLEQLARECIASESRIGEVLAALAWTNPILSAPPPAPPRVTSYQERARHWIGEHLRQLADRIDQDGAPL